MTNDASILPPEQSFHLSSNSRRQFPLQDRYLPATMARHSKVQPFSVVVAGAGRDGALLHTVMDDGADAAGAGGEGGRFQAVMQRLWGAGAQGLSSRPL